MNIVITNNKTEPIILNQENNIVIVLEKGARATVHDLHQSNERSVTITIHDDTQLDYIYSRKTNNTKTSLTVAVCQNSTFNFFAAIEASTHLTVTVQLQKPGAAVNLAGFYLLKEEQACSITTEQLHQAPNTHSNVLFNGVLYERAQSQYHGTIAIKQLARQSKAVQKNKNLLFGAQARAISVPNMEVKTNEVQCNHGSAVGRLDAEQLFYMQSRGLAIEHARQLLVDAFLQEVMAAVPDRMTNFCRENFIAVEG